jgi:hypothetical protein
MSKELTITDTTTGQTVFTCDAQIALNISVPAADLAQVNSLILDDNFVMSIGSNNSLQMNDNSFKYIEIDLQKIEPDPAIESNGTVTIGAIE